ncbi:MAG: Hint domain-containing protein, partial [Pseudomonadota bacterium]
GDDTFVYNVGDGADTITDFNSGNSGALGDGDTTNNDFIDLGAYYTNLSELRSDFDDDGVLNQSAGDYSDNTALAANDALTFQGADRGSFTADNTGVVCFRAGTQIATDHGAVAVETLRPGDLVVTADRGLQPVRWIGESVVPGFGQTAPIRIGAGALGRDLPTRDLWVSPQHRVLVRSKIVARMTGRDEALVPAVKLVGLPAITQEETADTVRYVHFMCDRHEVVFANGTPSETLFPGPMAQAMMTPEAWHELSLIRPQAIEPARSIVDGKRGVRLATRHRKNRHALVCVD